jgi:hypothetical protein
MNLKHHTLALVGKANKAFFSIIQQMNKSINMEGGFQDIYSNFCQALKSHLEPVPELRLVYSRLGLQEFWLG